MDKKIEDFLEEIAEGVDTETYNALIKDAMSMDTKSWIDKYRSMFQEEPSLAVAFKQADLDKYSKSKWDRYKDTFGSSDTENPYNKSNAWLKAVGKKIIKT